ncbi:MAG TPA: type II toxin-antitoxin system HicA family toxin [bacterium]|nr:type II toxin-antitoxin system HicA family toxin [bacterium]
MSNLPAFTGKTLIKALKKAGFEEIRIKGSHHFLRHKDGRCTIVPVHRGENIGRGLFSQILNDCEFTRAEFQKLL